MHTLSVKMISQSSDSGRSDARIDQSEVDTKLMLFIGVEILW
jgi:hypothetical protein